VTSTRLCPTGRRDRATQLSVVAEPCRPSSPRAVVQLRGRPSISKHRLRRLDVRNATAKLAGRSRSQVRVTVRPSAGGFGLNSTSQLAVAALLARASAATVRAVNSRGEKADLLFRENAESAFARLYTEESHRPRGRRLDGLRRLWWRADFPDHDECAYARRNYGSPVRLFAGGLPTPPEWASGAATASTIPSHRTAHRMRSPRELVWIPSLSPPQCAGQRRSRRDRPGVEVMCSADARSDGIRCASRPQSRASAPTAGSTAARRLSAPGSSWSAHPRRPDMTPGRPRSSHPASRSALSICRGAQMRRATWYRS